MVVGYRISPATYWPLRLLLTTRYLTLFNIAAGEAVAPEFWQDDCDGPHLAKAVGERLDDPALRARQTAAQYAALDKMGRGGPDPSEAAADAVMALLAKR
jgi:lipid-A-disaccharide synthase